MSAKIFNRPRAAGPFRLTAMALLSAAWLAASQSHAAAKGRWSDDVSRDQSFSRVLVVGLSPNLNQRCNFERALAATIRTDNTVAIVSCNVIPADTPLTRASIEAAVAAEDADAVLTTSLVSSSWQISEKGTNDTRGDAYYKATDVYYGLYGGVVAADFRTSAPVTNVRGKAQVTSELYETRDAKVVYTVETKARNIESTGSGMVDITDDIVKRLRKDGLIR